MPDIFSAGGDASYDATTDTFSFTAFAAMLDGAMIGGGGMTTVSATIDDTGTLSAGTISITGTVGSFMSGTLLTGILTDFGFVPGGGDPFEFLFDVTGGDAAAIFGATGGTIIGGTGFGGSFGTDFGGTAMTALSDTFPVPEPSTLVLLSLGMFAAFRRRR